MLIVVRIVNVTVFDTTTLQKFWKKLKRNNTLKTSERIHSITIHPQHLKAQSLCCNTPSTSESTILVLQYTLNIWKHNPCFTIYPQHLKAIHFVTIHPHHLKAILVLQYIHNIWKQSLCYNTSTLPESNPSVTIHPQHLKAILLIKCILNIWKQP